MDTVRIRCYPGLQPWVRIEELGKDILFFFFGGDGLVNFMTLAQHPRDQRCSVDMGLDGCGDDNKLGKQS